MTISEEIQQAMEQGMSFMFIEGFLFEWRRDPKALREAFEQAAKVVCEKRDYKIWIALKTSQRRNKQWGELTGKLQ